MFLGCMELVDYGETIDTGIFASKCWNLGGVDGLIAGNTHQFGIQLLGSLVIIVFSMVVSFIIYYTQGIGYYYRF